MSLALLASAAWFAITLVYRALALLALDRFAARARRARDRPASIDTSRAALVRPLRGAPRGMLGCLESLGRAARRAGARVVLGVEDPDDPARKDAERWTEGFGADGAELRIGRGPRAANRKIANLLQATRDLEAEIWVMSDADVRVPDDYVARMTDAFADERVGLTSCPYRSVPADGLGSRVDALVTNLHFAPNTCLAVRFEGLRFALGASIAVSSRALDAIGGLRAVADDAADDAALAAAIAGAGYRMEWAPLWVEHQLEESGWRSAWARQVRWARATRSTRPVGYLGLAAVSHGWLPACVAALLWTSAGGPGWLLPLGWWAAQLPWLWRVRKTLDLGPLDVALLPLVDAFALVVALAGLRGEATPPTLNPRP